MGVQRLRRALGKAGTATVTAVHKSASHGEAGYKRNDRDAYMTEPWVTQSLLQDIKLRNPVWEPACGDGRMACELIVARYDVIASDIHDYGYPASTLHDFLRDPLFSCSTVVTNPPFGLAYEFINRALEATRDDLGIVAILQRHEFDAPRRNWSLFAPPFAAKFILPRRPRWIDGPDKASPRFPYAWYIWDWQHRGEPVIRWLRH